MARFLVLGSLLFSTAALAGPGLFPQPSVLSLTSPEVDLAAEQIPEPHVPTLLAAGAFAGLLATPLALAAGAAFGTISNNLYAGLVPGLLPALLVPPLVVVFTEWLVAERSGEGRFRLIPALLVAVVAQAAILAVGIFTGVNATNGSGIAVISLASAVALPTVTTAMLKLTERSPVVSVPVLTGSF